MCYCSNSVKTDTVVTYFVHKLYKKMIKCYIAHSKPQPFSLKPKKNVSFQNLLTNTAKGKD